MMDPAYQVEAKVRIYCNRSLTMETIKAIGFDLDYTLAVYKPETFEVLAYEETLKKLVSLGYPEAILGYEFDVAWLVRGLAIDKARGNIFKMDRHRYVKVAYHGFRELTREERRRLYDAQKVLSYEEPDFALVDTLFSLAETYLFAQLVELRDSGVIFNDYSDIYKDIRYAIDLCHRDGSIKKRVAEDPGRYIKRDPHLFETLARLRDSGRKLFVVTNSLWDYANVVMNYLAGNDGPALNTDWMSIFDVIITGASKPAFFINPAPLYEVDLETGLLRNAAQPTARPGVAFQGGNYLALQDLLGIRIGSEVLYVGDHIYGDILRSKKNLGWRTMLVIEELEKEIEVLEQCRDSYFRFEELMQLKEDLEDEVQRLQFAISSRQEGLPVSTGLASVPAVELAERLKLIIEERNRTRETLRESLKAYHQRFHPVWGELMKTGHQNSRFAAQVENYACLYTSKVSNFRFYSPNKSYRSTRDFMPHDFI